MRKAGILGGTLLVGVLVWALRVEAAPPPPEPPRPTLRELEAAVARDPGNPSLRVALGLAYWERKESPRAFQEFRKAVEVGPRSAEAHNWLGVALSARSDLPGAVAEFRTAIALDPKYGRAYSNLGSALAKSGDYTEAVAVLEKALGLEPNSVGAHFNLGMALREKGDLEAARGHLGQVVEADPTNDSVRYELGQTLRQMGDLPGAVSALEKAIEINPELREGYYGLGMALRQQAAAVRRPPPGPSPADAAYERGREAAGRGELKAAREHLTEALRQDESHGEAHALMGFLLGQQGELAQALAHLERAVALRPDSPQAHYSLGVALWYSGARPRALAELRRSVELDPAAGSSHSFLGTALRETGDLEGARASLQRAIALLPPTAAVYVDLGITYLRQGDLDHALGQLDAGLNLPAPWHPEPDWSAAAAGLAAALEKSPGRAEAHNALGLLLGRQGVEGGRVAAEFREAIRLRPDYAEAHNHLGLVLVQSGDDPAGIDAFRAAVRLAPGYADAHANLGAVLIPTDSEEAVRELEKAVDLAPTLVKARFNLAAAYGSGPAALRAKEVEQLRKVVELAPTFARAHLALGKALLREGNVPEAVTELREAVKLEPQRGEAHYQLGLALARAGSQEEAAPVLKKGRELVAEDERNQTASLDLAEGRAALQRGELEQAAAKLRSAARLRPDSGEAQRSLGEVLEKQGDAKGAADAYRKSLELNPADAAARRGLEGLMSAPPPVSDDPARMAELERLIREGRFAAVEPLLSEYVRQHPQSSWGFYALGYALGAQQKLGESIQALARSLELDVRNAEAHKMLGRTLMVIGRFDSAQLEFEQALRYKPDSAEIHYNLGKLFSIQDNWEPARKALEAAVRLDPSYVQAVDALGFAQEALGDDMAALESYRRAAALNEAQQGRFATPQVNLSAYYNRAGDPQTALVHARAALDLDPQSDRAWFQKAKADEQQGRLAEAVESLQRAIAINSRSSSYHYVLAGLYRRLGKAEESQAALEAFRRLDRESSELEKARRRDSRANAAAPRPEG